MPNLALFLYGTPNIHTSSDTNCIATKTMGFLRPNLALAPRYTTEVAYKTLVRPQLEYAAPIWQPYIMKLGEGGEGTEDSCQMDLQAMEKYKLVESAICWTNLSGHPWRPVGSSLP